MHTNSQKIKLNCALVCTNANGIKNSNLTQAPTSPDNRGSTFQKYNNESEYSST